MEGRPVIIRLIDPPLHEFLPDLVELVSELADLKIRLKHAADMAAIDTLLAEIRQKEQFAQTGPEPAGGQSHAGSTGGATGHLHSGTDHHAGRAIFEAACMVVKEGIDVHPEVMIPLTSHVNELIRQRAVLEAEAKAVMTEQGMEIDYKFGTMIELPRAALTADQIAEHAEFFSFGTNDLTQTTFGISRDDAETGFLIEYMESGILPANPFATLDRDGVGALIDMAVKRGRATKPDLECGICGEHGGDPQSIAMCHELGLTYVSCSRFRVPIARLAAAHAR
jgi:pyruvate,orthophosphate dikinase